MVGGEGQQGLANDVIGEVERIKEKRTRWPNVNSGEELRQRAGRKRRHVNDVLDEEAAMAAYD